MSNSITHSDLSVALGKGLVVLAVIEKPLSGPGTQHPLLVFKDSSGLTQKDIF